MRPNEHDARLADLETSYRELTTAYVLAINREKEAKAMLAALTAAEPDPLGRPDVRYLGATDGLHLCKLSTRALEARRLLGMTEET